MFCLLVSPDPLRRALLLSDSEQPRPASQTVAVVGGAPPTTPPSVYHHVAVDIPDEDDNGGYDSDADELEKTQEHISPVRRALVRAVFVAYTASAAPALVTTAFTRSNSCLQALLVVVPVVLTIVSLFMATVRVSEDEDREREEEEQGLKG